MNNNLTQLLDLSQTSVLGLTWIEDSICFHLQIDNNEINCPHCDSIISELHQNKPSLIRDLPVFGKPVYLRIPRRQ